VGGKGGNMTGVIVTPRIGEMGQVRFEQGGNGPLRWVTWGKFHSEGNKERPQLSGKNTRAGYTVGCGKKLAKQRPEIKKRSVPREETKRRGKTRDRRKKRKKNLKIVGLKTKGSSTKRRRGHSKHQKRAIKSGPPSKSKENIKARTKNKAVGWGTFIGRGKRKLVLDTHTGKRENGMR